MSTFADVFSERPEREPVHDQADDHERREHQRRHRQRRPAEARVAEPGGEGAEHQELAMRDVEDAHQPVLQVQAERDQRVDAAGDQAGGDQLDPRPRRHGLVPVGGERAGPARPTYFQAGLFGFSAAVAIAFGQTTSNSPFCHWLTLPGVPTFSLPAKRILPRIVECSWPAT